MVGKGIFLSCKNIEYNDYVYLYYNKDILNVRSEHSKHSEHSECSERSEHSKHGEHRKQSECT